MRNLLLAVALLSLCACTRAGGTTDDARSSASAPVAGGMQRAAYIHSVAVENGTRTMQADLAEAFFTGADAGKAIKRDNPDCAKDSLDDTCVPPHGWYLRNRDTNVSTLMVASDVYITLTYASEPHPSFEEFMALINEPDSTKTGVPFWVTVRNGVVVAIREQLIP